MKTLISTSGIALAFFGLSCLMHCAENSKTIYASTLSTVTIGSAAQPSALFYKPIDSDGNWKYFERPNNLVFGFDIFTPSKGKILAMAAQNGVFLSSDYGKTWKQTTDWRVTEVQCVVFDPKNPDIIYAGTPYGFYKTTDSGKTWDKFNKGLVIPDESYVSGIAVDYSKPGRILISTENGVYVSTDSGASWSRIDGLTIKHIRTIVQHPTKPDIFAIGTENNGIYFSYDSGKSWTKCNSEVPQQTFYVITFDKNNPDTVYAGGFKTGVYKSTDTGTSWKIYFKGLDCLDVQAIDVVPGDSKQVFAGTLAKGVFKSNDGGETWTAAGLNNSMISKILIEPF